MNNINDTSRTPDEFSGDKDNAKSVDSWPEKKRPMCFEDQIGTDHITDILQTMLSSDKNYPLLIFTGQKGTGKSTTALNYVKSIYCLDEKLENRPCGECLSCKNLKEKNDYFLDMVNAGENGGIDIVRSFEERCLNHIWRTRVFLIDEAHNLSIDAQTALLRLTEGVHKRLIVILVTTDIDKLLDTIRSRGMVFEFRPHRREHIVKRLIAIAESEGMFVNDNVFVPDISLLNLMAEKSNGDMRAAIKYLQLLYISYGNVPSYQNALLLFAKDHDDLIIRLLLHVMAKDSFDNHFVNKLLASLSEFKKPSEIIDGVYRVVYNALSFLNGKKECVNGEYLDSYARLCGKTNEVKLIELFHYLKRECESVGNNYSALSLTLLNINRMYRK